MAGSLREQQAGFNPSIYKPQTVAELQCFDRGELEPDTRYMIINPATGDFAILSEIEKDLWELMDGQRTVEGICSRYLDAKQSLVMTHVYFLLQRLWSNQLLKANPYFADKAEDDLELDDEGDDDSLGTFNEMELVNLSFMKGIISKLSTALKSVKFEHNVSMFIITLLGLTTFFLYHKLPRLNVVKPFSKFDIHLGSFHQHVEASYIVGCLLILFLHLITSFMRHSFTATLEKKATGQEGTFKFILNYGMPCFKYDSNWRHSLPLRQRLMISFSGIAFDLVLATICTIFLLLVSVQPTVFDVLFKLIHILYLRSFFHLSPFRLSDLNQVFEDLSQVRNFRLKVIGFFRTNFINSILGKISSNRDTHHYVSCICMSALWFGAMVHVGIAILNKETYFFSDIVNYSDARKTQAQILIVLVCIPIVTSAVISLVWFAYVVAGMVTRLKVFQKLVNLQLPTLIIPALIYLLSFLLEDESHRVVVHLIAVGLLTFSIFFLLKCLKTSAQSNLALSITCLWIVAMVSIMEQLFEVFMDDYQFVKLGSMVKCILLILPFITIIAWQLFLKASKRNKSFPYICILFCGASFFAHAFVEFLGVSFGESAEVLYDVFRMSGLIFLFGASLTFSNALSNFISIKSLYIYKGKKEQDELQSMYIFMQDYIHGELRQLLGRTSRRNLERYIAKRLNQPRFSFRTSVVTKPNESCFEIGQRMWDIILAVTDYVEKICGQSCADKLFNRLNENFNYESQVLMQKYVYCNTRFENHVFKSFTENEINYLVNRIPIFSSLTKEEKAVLFTYMSLHHYKRGDLLIEAGDESDVAFITIEGELQVEAVDVAGFPHIVAFLSRGDFFGESAFLDDAKRISNVRAKSNVTLLSLRSDDFDLLSQVNPKAVDKIKRNLSTLNVLFTIPLFTDLPVHLLQSILPQFTELKVSKGNVIFNKGDFAELYYLIKEGSVELDDEKNGKTTLGANESFGEKALLSETRRAISAHATLDCVLLALEKSAFHRLTYSSHLFHENVHQDEYKDVVYA